MNMAEENPPRSVPETGKESPVDASPLTDRGYTPPVRRSPKRRKNIVILTVIAVVLIGGVFLWRYLSTYQSTDAAQADVHLHPVSPLLSRYLVRLHLAD